MIDAETGVATEGVTKILPEGINTLAGVLLSQRVGPTLPDKTAIGVPHLRPKPRIINPALWCLDVKIGRHDVVVAG